ncbi:MAG TPA: alginate lyase family protein [Anaerohalosphaeraceae bacterium]|nr:alginate lyase family protein [Anaerohalosphaeraceae bacterium]
MMQGLGVSVFVWIILGLQTPSAFVHPGLLSTRVDLERIRAKVAAGEQPWNGSWDILVSNTNSFLHTKSEAVPIIYAGEGHSENYIRLARDCARAYQCALRYQISGETAYGDKAVEILNAWASVMTGWQGDTNVSLRAGLYGYQLACAAELMRDYSGWSADAFAAFQTWMLNVFYAKNSSFLASHHGTCSSHYWANWDLANVASVMAIGVLCDRQDIFQEGLNYFYHGEGNGSIRNAVHFIHPDGLGQWQESGRDQGHTLMGVPLLGTICEMAWNQGIDLYGYDDNRVLAGCESIAKYNLGQEVPFVIYMTCRYPNWPAHSAVSSTARGQMRPGWEMIYNHYVNRKGLSAPYTRRFAEKVRPEGGGFNYGTTSGGFDQLGFTTLTHTLEPIASKCAPSALRLTVQGRQIVLAWAGSASAQSYNIKRRISHGGPYTTIAKTKETHYTDSGLTPGITYYYTVSSNIPKGETEDCAPAAATANQQLFGTVIGTEGSYQNAGAVRDAVFDGCLQNFFDAPNRSAWAGLDFGEGVRARITEIRYCPRPGYGSRMVGGRFQGSNTADFTDEVVDLFIIRTQPPDGVLTSQPISNPNWFRYVRYLSPADGYGNAAEVQFFGETTSSLKNFAPPPNQ